MRKEPPIIREFESNQEFPSENKVNYQQNGFEESAAPYDRSKGNLNEEINSNLNIKQQNPAETTPLTTAEKIGLTVLPVLVALLVLMVALVIYLAPNDTTIVIMGTNDLHGKVYPTNLFREDNDQEYKYGGLVYMTSIMETMKKEYPGRTLYLDAGDEFQGGIESSALVSSGEIMNDFFTRAGLAGSAIGNHEFDFGPEFLFNYLNGRESPNLAANIQSEKNESDFMPHQKGSELFEFQNNIKIGVIGLSTLETPTTTATFINGKFPPYKFLAYKDQVVERSAELRKQGASAVLIVSHVGNYCNNNFTNAVRTNETVSEECQDDEIAKLIDSLPEGTIDGIVQGHRHRISHHYKKNIPIIGTINGGYYVNFMYLTFNRNKELIKTSIEGPVPVCEKVFENTQRCNYLQGQELEDAGQLVNWNFHGTEVKADEKLQQTLNEKWSEKMSVFMEKLVKNEVILERNGDKETEVGNLFTNLLHEVVPDSDFSILNTGGFRTIWYPGVIDYEQFYNMFPFINNIVTFTMTGTELVNSLNILQSGKEFFPTWNIQSTINIDSNMVRTVTGSKFSNGTAIDPNTVYKGVSIDYLINGGDRFSQVIGSVYTPTAKTVLGEFRELIKPHLINLSVIKENSLIDPLNRRLIINNV